MLSFKWLCVFVCFWLLIVPSHSVRRGVNFGPRNPFAQEWFSEGSTGNGHRRLVLIKMSLHERQEMKPRPPNGTERTVRGTDPSHFNRGRQINSKPKKFFFYSPSLSILLCTGEERQQKKLNENWSNKTAGMWLFSVWFGSSSVSHSPFPNPPKWGTQIATLMRYMVKQI